MSPDSDNGIRWIRSQPGTLPEEKVIYQQGLVRITNLVAEFRSDRYSIWAITSARKSIYRNYLTNSSQ